MVDICPDSSWKSQRGQVLLVVVLVMIVALTVGLSLISRSITNLRTSTEEAESQKALAAAEAGIERALESETDIPLGSFDSAGTDVTYKTDVTRVQGTEFAVNGGNEVPKDDGVDIWLSEYTSSDSIFNIPLQSSANITIYWGDSADACQTAALEIVVVSGSKASPTLQRYTSEPCDGVGVDRQSFNNFEAATAANRTIQGVTFRWSKTLPVIANGFIIRITPVYHDTKLGISSNVALPLQGNIITSTGESGKTQRSISVFQGFPKIPSELFPYAIFSPED